MKHFIFLALACSQISFAKPIVVFDLDHTLVDTNLRIIAILRDLAVLHDLPQLLDLTPGQIEALRRRDPGTLAALTAEVREKIFGGRDHAALKRSPFGERFYADPSYLVYDGLIPGAPEFVNRLEREVGVEIWFITGRFESFRRATKDQLKNWRLWSTTRRLILKPLDFSEPTDVFKVAEFTKLMRTGPIVAVFDDASRNVNAFARLLPAGVPIVRLTRDVAHRANVDARVEQITNYLFNRTLGADGGAVNTVNSAQIDRIIARARACARALDADDAVVPSID